MAVQGLDKGLKSNYHCLLDPRMQAEQSTVRVNKRLQKPKWVTEAQKEVAADGIACSLSDDC